MNFLNKLWKKDNNTKQTSAQTPKETYIDLIITLGRDKQIDFSLSLDDKMEKIDMSLLDYSILCSEFLNVVLSDHLKVDSADILTKQIKNSSNQELIDNIVTLINISKKKQDKSATGKKFINKT